MWNVRSLYPPGKLDNLLKEMTRLKVSILGLSEHRWPGNGLVKHDWGTFYYSGNSDTNHRHGVGILVDNATKDLVSSFVPVSDRIPLLRLKQKKTTLNVIQVYAPTADPKYDEEIDKFYEEIQNLISSVKKADITIIMGDLNAKIGRGRRDE